MIKVVTTEVWLHPWSISGYALPSMQKARLKTVYYQRGFIKFRLRRYLVFKSIDIDQQANAVYFNHYTRLK